jgi:hypothetical protein
MPYSSQSVPAEKFMSYKGIDIYHVYKDDDIEQGVRDFLFDTDEDSSEDNDTTIYVPELSTWKAPKHPPYCQGKHDNPKNHKAWEVFHGTGGAQEKAIKEAIKKAIDKGEITEDGVAERA